MVGDLAAVEHSVLLEYTSAMAEPSAFDYTTSMLQIMVAAAME